MNIEMGRSTLQASRPNQPARSAGSSSAGLPLLPDPAGQLGPGGEAQLGEDVLDVRVDRALGEEKPPGDLPVAEAVGDQAGHLPFTPGEPAHRAARRTVRRTAWPVA